MKRRRIIFAALLVAVLGGFTWAVLRSSEPSYQGKPLGKWLELYVSRQTNGVLSIGRNPLADEAVRQIGTNAIPTLFRLLLAKDSKFKLKLIALSKKQTFITFRFTPAWEYRQQAYYGFIALGKAAKQFMPEVVELLNHPDPEIQRDAMNVIVGVGVNSNTIPALLPLLKQGPLRVDAAAALGTIGPDAESVIPDLLIALRDPDSGVRNNAAWALGRIHRRPEVVIPALIETLSDKSSGPPNAAAGSLGAFGPEAKAAVPELLKLLKNTQVPTAPFALKKIDPEAAEKAGVK